MEQALGCHRAPNKMLANSLNGIWNPPTPTPLRRGGAVSNNSCNFSRNKWSNKQVCWNKRAGRVWTSLSSSLLFFSLFPPPLASLFVTANKCNTMSALEERLSESVCCYPYLDDSLCGDYKDLRKTQSSWRALEEAAWCNEEEATIKRLFDPPLNVDIQRTYKHFYL